tara:strand:- start:273 stop:380 length:108 start_codon:yes stop_codon:yes gene_type:complete
MNNSDFDKNRVDKSRAIDMEVKLYLEKLLGFGKRY